MCLAAINLHVYKKEIKMLKEAKLGGHLLEFRKGREGQGEDSAFLQASGSLRTDCSKQVTLLSSRKQAKVDGVERAQKAKSQHQGP
jgi:hypothetical protein